MTGRVVVALIALALAPIARPALAQPGLTIEASLDKTHVAVGEEAQVTIIAEARGVDLPNFTLRACRDSGRSASPTRRISRGRTDG